MYGNEYFQLFMKTENFPAESRAPLSEAFAKLTAAKDCGPLLQTAEDALFGGKEWREAIAPPLKEVSEQTGIHPYTVDLLFLVAESERLRADYKAAGLDEAIFWNSMADLLYKLVECHDVYGIWGTFVAWWHPWFYTRKRFAFGRLQFEAVPFEGSAPVTVGGHTIRPGDTVYNMHIPSAGPLTKESRLDAYRRAYEFYRKADGEWLCFVCESWLLFPAYREILSPTSNIVSFMDDFHIYFEEKSEFYDSWRVFGKDFEKPFAELPEDTSMRRAFKKYLLAGGGAGAGYGLFFFNGKEFIK